jgi:hypothetical protein
MTLMNSWTCLARGHAFRAVTHEGSDYQFCLRCGKITPGQQPTPSRDEELSVKGSDDRVRATEIGI